MVSGHYAAYWVVGSSRKLAVVELHRAGYLCNHTSTLYSRLYSIRIFAGTPESMVKILTFYSGLLGHCQDNKAATFLPSRYST
jgi:hypothetical protein